MFLVLFAAACLAIAAAATDDATTTLEEILTDENLDGRAFGERWIAEISAAELAAVLAKRHDLVPPVLGRLSDAWTFEPEIGRYLSRCARILSRRIAASGPPWTEEDVNLLLTVHLVHPLRFVEEPDFRARVMALLPDSLDPETPRELRDRLLGELNRVRGFGFEDSERVELAWGAVARASGDRRVDWGNGEFLVSKQTAGPIEASLYSLPSRYFRAEEAQRFLTALAERRPDRRLVVLTDLPLGRRSDTVQIETHGRDYSPWTRDPLLFAHREDGGVVVIQRPNLQRDREQDSDLGRELIQGLPTELDRQWGEVRWTTAPIPFHNGQVLKTDNAVWLSIHSLETRILEILGLERVPVASFHSADGIDRYLGAIRQAAVELEELYHRPARFIHPLPDGGPNAERAALLGQIGGGAGFDLDSYLSLIPGHDGPPVALVADIAEGIDLLRRLPAEDWHRLRSGYSLQASPAELSKILPSYQEEGRVQRLRSFLDLVAEHFEAEGLTVYRLPHFLVPTSLLPEAGDIDYSDFQITWNNVVHETLAGGELRAEGFSSLLDHGDEIARDVFARAGGRLELLPPLIPSIVRNGGYRCASNHLRLTAE